MSEANEADNKLYLHWNISECRGSACINLGLYLPCGKRLFNRLMRLIVLCDEPAQLLAGLYTFITEQIEILKHAKDPALLKQLDQFEWELDEVTRYMINI